MNFDTINALNELLATEPTFHEIESQAIKIGRFQVYHFDNENILVFRSVVNNTVYVTEPGCMIIDELASRIVSDTLPVVKRFSVRSGQLSLNCKNYNATESQAETAWIFLEKYDLDVYLNGRSSGHLNVSSIGGSRVELYGHDDIDFIGFIIDHDIDGKANVKDKLESIYQAVQAFKAL